MREAAEGCARAGIGFIGLWRDKVSETGLADVFAPLQTADSVAKNPDVLAGVEVILSGWGAPAMDTAFRGAHAPHRRLAWYVAGEPLEYEITRERAALMA